MVLVNQFFLVEPHQDHAAPDLQLFVGFDDPASLADDEPLAHSIGDFKSALQEWLQSRGDLVPEYRLVAETGPAHRKSFDVEVVVEHRSVGRAEGRSKKEAEQGAARAALISLGALET
jgi:ribonuclease-3